MIFNLKCAKFEGIFYSNTNKTNNVSLFYIKVAKVVIINTSVNGAKFGILKGFLRHDSQGDVFAGKKPLRTQDVIYLSKNENYDSIPKYFSSYDPKSHVFTFKNDSVDLL